MAVNASVWGYGAPPRAAAKSSYALTSLPTPFSLTHHQVSPASLADVCCGHFATKMLMLLLFAMLLAMARVTSLTAISVACTVSQLRQAEQPMS